MKIDSVNTNTSLILISSILVLLVGLLLHELLEFFISHLLVLSRLQNLVAKLSCTLHLLLITYIQLLAVLTQQMVSSRIPRELVLLDLCYEVLSFARLQTHGYLVYHDEVHPRLLDILEDLWRLWNRARKPLVALYLFESEPILWVRVQHPSDDINGFWR